MSEKKKLITVLKNEGVKKINGKYLAKCNIATLKEELYKLRPDLQPAEPVKKAVLKKEDKKEEEQVEEKIDVMNMSGAEIMQKALAVAAAAKKAGEANKDKITKRRVTRSKWADEIKKLLESENNKSEDGVYSFSLQEVIDLTGWETQSKRNPQKCASWVLFSGDWKPTYKGLGSAFVLLGYKATVKGAPSSKANREAFSVSGNQNWQVKIEPISHKQQLDLVVPRVKGTIKHWVYTQEQLSELRANIDIESETAAS